MRRPPLPRILLPLRHRDFRLLLIGQTVSSFGNFFFLIAVPFQLIALGASPIELGITVSILGLSTLTFMLLGGAIADRVPRRWLILGNDAIGGTVTAIVAILAWTGQLRIEHIYVAAAILGVAFAFLLPAYSAIVAELIPPDLLTEANAARALGGTLARTGGPLAAGLVIAFAGTPLAFTVDALTFFISFALFLLSAPLPRPAPVEVPILRQVRDGIAFVLRTPWLWMTLVGLTFINVTYGAQRGVMTPLFVRDSLHQGAAVFGLVTAAFGVGQLIGAFAVAQVRIARPGVAMYAFETLGGLATLAIGLVISIPAMLIFMAVMGFALSSSDALFGAALQRNVPQAMLGRVTSINFLIGGLLIPVAPILAGDLVDTIGPAATFVVMGAWAAGLAALLLVVSPVRALR